MAFPKPMRARDLMCETLEWESSFARSYQKWAAKNPDKVVVKVVFFRTEDITWHGAGVVWYIHPEAAQNSVTGESGVAGSDTGPGKSEQ